MKIGEQLCQYTRCEKCPINKCTYSCGVYDIDDRNTLFEILAIMERKAVEEQEKLENIMKSINQAKAELDKEVEE